MESVSAPAPDCHEAVSDRRLPTEQGEPLQATDTKQLRAKVRPHPQEELLTLQALLPRLKVPAAVNQRKPKPPRAGGGGVCGHNCGSDKTQPSPDADQTESRTHWGLGKVAARPLPDGCTLCPRLYVF